MGEERYTEQIIELSCDWDDCREMHTERGPTLEFARAEARGVGWAVHSTGVRCPEHIGLRRRTKGNNT